MSSGPRLAAAETSARSTSVRWLTLPGYSWSGSATRWLRAHQRQRDANARRPRAIPVARKPAAVVTVLVHHVSIIGFAEVIVELG